LGAEPSDAECLAHLAGVTARALGVATQADLTEYHRLSLTQTRLMTDAVLAAGLTPVAIAGLSGRSGTVPGWADPAALAEGSAATTSASSASSRRRGPPAWRRPWPKRAAARRWLCLRLWG